MGSASFFRNGLGTLAGILLNRIAVGYGTSALAAINVANRITMFMTSACLGFGQGFQPVAQVRLLQKGIPARGGLLVGREAV